MNNSYQWKLEQQDGYVEDVSSLVDKEVDEDKKTTKAGGDGAEGSKTNDMTSQSNTNNSHQSNSENGSDHKLGNKNDHKSDGSSGILQSPGINMSHPLIPPMPQLSQVPPLSQMPQLSQMGQVPHIQQVPQLSSLQMSSGSPVSQLPQGPQGSQGSPDMSEDDQDGNQSRRPLSTTRRAAQNRSAQKAFRQRKERYIKDLETQAAEVKGLKQTIDELRTENLRLRDYTIALQSRIIELGSDSFNQHSDSNPSYNKMNQ